MIKLQLKEGYGYVDISSATLKNIIIKKPDDTILTNTASFFTDGTDGIIYYTTVEDDLDQAGTYYVQSYIEMPTFEGYSTPTSFVVYDNL